MDFVHEDATVLEDATLGLEVKLVVTDEKFQLPMSSFLIKEVDSQMTVDFTLSSILSKEATKDSLSAHPQDLGGHTSL